MVAASGCTTLLGGFEPPPTGNGEQASASSSGSTSSSSSTAGGSTSGSGGTGGACSIYDGTGTTTITDALTANLPAMVVGNDGSISALYSMGFTEIGLGGTHAGYCGLTFLVDISGPPVVGSYTVVATSPYNDPNFATGSNKAYVFAAGTPAADGGCDSATQGFGSIAGSGTVQITSVQGTQVKFTVTNVQAAGISDAMCAEMGFPCNGTGTIKISIQGEADCFSSM